MTPSINRRIIVPSYSCKLCFKKLKSPHQNSPHIQCQTYLLNVGLPNLYPSTSSPDED